MYVHVYTMYIHVHRFSELYIHVYTFHQMYVHVWTMCMMRMYYSIVHTHHIHRSDMFIHVYARWVGFQMKPSHKLKYFPQIQSEFSRLKIRSKVRKCTLK
jgi:hypothetical protein